MDDHNDTNGDGQAVADRPTNGPATTVETAAKTASKAAPKTPSGADPAPRTSPLTALEDTAEDIKALARLTRRSVPDTLAAVVAAGFAAMRTTALPAVKR